MDRRAYKTYVARGGRASRASPAAVQQHVDSGHDDDPHDHDDPARLPDGFPRIGAAGPHDAAVGLPFAPHPAVPACEQGDDDGDRSCFPGHGLSIG
jgi:hypothetical protein